MAMNITMIITKSFPVQNGGSGFVPCRSAPAYR